MSYRPVIGLEVHAQLRTRTKLFCACPVAFGGAPNSRVCPVCMGHPGTLPVLNEAAVRHAARFALAVGATLHSVSRFDRKHYFYPDLPKGFQITQVDAPLATGGRIVVATPSGDRAIRIERIHLEEDAGKSLHPQKEGDPTSRVDLNRCGIPLAEIVTEPALFSPEEARECFSHIRDLLVWLEACDGNMEEGSLRCDANVSLSRSERSADAGRVELKNLNSLRFLRRALRHEIERQEKILASGGAVETETRAWDERARRTLPLRDKESSEDYRYFAEPDLPPLRLDPTWVKEAREGLPELPDARAQRLARGHGLPPPLCRRLVGERAVADAFERTVEAGADPRQAALWILETIPALLRGRGVSIDASPVRPAELAALLREVASGRLSARQAKEALGTAVATGKDPMKIAIAEGMERVDDAESLNGWIDAVFSADPGAAALYRTGKEGILHHLVGEVLRLSKGKADPKAAGMRIRERLERESQ